MVPVAKARLEQICVEYLNHQPRIRAVERIELGRPAAGSANWSIELVEPHFDLMDVKITFAAVRELQSVFRMVV